MPPNISNTRSAGAGANADISLVARENYLVFQPMLPEIIGGHIDLLHAISPIRRLAPHTRLFTREVESIDLSAKTVTLAPGFGRSATSAFRSSGHRARDNPRLRESPRVTEHALPFKYLGDALRLRNQLVSLPGGGRQ